MLKLDALILISGTVQLALVSISRAGTDCRRKHGRTHKHCGVHLPTTFATSTEAAGEFIVMTLDARFVSTSLDQLFRYRNVYNVGDTTLAPTSLVTYLSVAPTSSNEAAGGFIVITFDASGTIRGAVGYGPYCLYQRSLVFYSET